jgi:hypothetical protein
MRQPNSFARYTKCMFGKVRKQGYILIPHVYPKLKYVASKNSHWNRIGTREKLDGCVTKHTASGFIYIFYSYAFLPPKKIKLWTKQRHRC